MATINEAYRVLADPGRRAAYDRSLTARTPLPEELITDSDSGLDSGPEPPIVPRNNPLSPAGPARIPWRMMAVAAVIGSVAVLISSMFSRDPKVERPDGILRAGSCVALEANGDAHEVACSGGPDDIVVAQLVPLHGQCPTGTVGHRDRQGLGIACVTA